jgi:zinc protease
MGFLLKSLTEGTVDGQRDVVKNERRQSYENQPYGKAWLALPPLLYGKEHPYSWSVIGSMEDLSAAKLQDVVDFFTQYYTPGNAALSIAGDIDLKETRKKIEYWFSDVKPGKKNDLTIPPVAKLTEENRVVLEDKVQLPQLRMVWLTPPVFTPGDAEMDLIGSLLAGGKNSRLYKKLVYELQLAQNVGAFNSSKKFNSEFQIIATARPGVTLAQLEKVIQEEINKLKTELPQERELARTVNQYEASFIRQLESAGGKADRLNYYYYYTGNPDYFNEDLQRYKAISASDISSAVRQYLKDDARVIMSIVPEGKQELAATKN